jgi:4-aminobutyrate aminotransferase/(S)-3-amino-2-methylpropionate transaminase
MDVASLLAKDQQYCSYGDTVHYADPPKVFASCEGSYLYDEHGTPYLDLQMWYSAASFGYKNKRLNETLKNQIDRLPQLACQYLHEEKVLLAEEICKNIEARTGMKGRVQFNVGGAQAIEDALKIIRNYTKKNLMFSFMGGYHGRTLAASEITSSYRYRRPFGHFSDRASFQPYPYCFRCPYGKEVKSCDSYCVSQFKELFATEYNSYWDPKAKESEFVGFFMEFVQGTGGYIIPPLDYFSKLQKILQEHGILMVADEIQMGFYRTGKFWSFEHFNVKPDIIVFGKALTNGLNPISGIWAREDLISPAIFPPGSTHSTFSSNPLGTATGLEVMKMLREENYEQKVNEAGRYFLEELKKLKERWKMIGNVDGLGLALRIEMCTEDGYTPNREITDKIFNEGLKGDLEVNNKKYGLVLDIGGYFKNVFTIAPCFDITREEIDLALKLFEMLLKRCGAQ